MSEQSFGKYQLLKKLATGGMAEVWLARQVGIEGFQRNLVVKRILPHLADDPEFVQMFLNEAKIAARFSHPNIAQIYDLGETNGTYFIAMEFIHGEDLGRLMRKAWSTGQWIARQLAIRIVASCCEGLYYAHTKTDEGGRPLRVVHRDISPQNILISFDGSVKLVDFGIAKAADQASLTKSGAIKGKFAYMSPEQAAGKALDHRTDIFAIGLVLYELLTGVRPLKRDNEIATLQAALECAIEPPSAVADVPPELDGVVMKALSKAADDRYRDARQFQLALEELLVSQRWVASSVQIAELMSTLFADRLEEEAKLGHPEPHGADSQLSVPAAKDAPERLPPPKAKVNTAEMEWEAPPGTMDGSRSASRPATRAGPRTESSLRSPAPPPEDVPDWEAPPAAEVPGRRRTETSAPRKLSNPNETAIARTPSRPDMRRPTDDSPPPRRSSETRIAPMGELEDDRSERHERPSRDERHARLAAREDRADDYPDEREEDDDEAELTLPPPPAPRRGPSTSMPRSNTRGAVRAALAEVEEPATDEHDEDEDELPQPTQPVPKVTPRKKAPAPPPPAIEKPRKPVKAEPPPPQARPSRGAMTSFLDAEAVRAQTRRKQSTWVLYACLALVGVLVIFVFKQPIMDTLGARGSSSGQDVVLKVKSNLPVRVLVRHHKDENLADSAREQELAARAGAEPIRGAHLRDTVILENKEMGARYEEEIGFGQPDETRVISKEFRQGWVRFELQGPGKMDGLPIYENGAERGRYSKGAKIEFYEGKHVLELHDEAGQLIGKPFEVDVKPGDTITVKRTLLRNADTRTQEALEGGG